MRAVLGEKNLSEGCFGREKGKFLLGKEGRAEGSACFVLPRI